MTTVRLVQRGKQGTWWAFASLPGNRQLRRSLHTADRAVAEARKAELESSLSAGVTPEPSMSVGAWLERWLDDVREAGRTPTTLRTYTRIVRAYVIPRIGKVRLDALTVGDVERMDADLLRHGGRKRSALDPVTVRQIHDMLSSALHDAQRHSLLLRNVASLARRPRVPHREPQWLEREELLRLFEGARTHDWGAFSAVAALTGLRAGELCGLRWEDVDTAAQGWAIHVRRQRRYDGPGVGFVDAAPKSAASTRTVPVSTEARQWLSQVRERQAEHAALLGVTPSAWVFAHSGRGKARGTWVPWTPVKASKGVADLYAACGLPKPKRPIHTLRHTTATLMADAQEDPKVRAALLGHGVGQTFDYTHRSRASGERAMRAVGEVTHGGGTPER